MSRIVLAGGAEFGGEMALLDRRAILLAGGPKARVSIIPAAAAPDKNHIRAGKNGVQWFRKLGAAKVAALPLIDRASADDPEVAAALARSDLIYLLGGFPDHLADSLAGSRSWDAIASALSNKAVISGTSAGAMVLCEHFFDPRGNRLAAGLKLIPGACVLPHHDTFGRSWAPRLKRLIPRATLIGLDERTGIVSENSPGQWRVYGPGSVWLYRKNRIQEFGSPDTIFF